MDGGSPLPDAVTRLEIELGRGLREGLRYLNERTDHRFTGVYRFDPPLLRNLHLFDAENPSLEIADDVPLDETYCSLVSVTGDHFSTSNALEDARLTDHPARESVLSYCGVLLRDDQGLPFGTLCHFDFAARRVPEEEVWFLEVAARRIMQALETHPQGSRQLSG